MKKISVQFLVFLSLFIPTAGIAQCGDLFFSEYIEGSSSNKAMEIFNPTSSAVNLSDYVVYRNNNGSLTPTDSLFPQGMLPADSVYVFSNPSANAAIAAQGDTTHTLTFYNGDDAVWLKKISTGDTLDIIGVIGVDPGSGWTVGTGATNNFTLVRKASVLSGQLDWTVGVTEWDVFPIDVSDSLGAHTKLTCGTPVIDLVITEIMYNPAAITDSMEFIEIYNNGSSMVDLTGFNFTQGVVYTFPSVTVAPSSFVLVARDSVAMNNVFGVIAYEWASGSLSNSGEDVVLVDNLGNTIDSVDYDDASPWPVGPPTPDGGGPSIELTDVSLDNNLASSWVISTTVVAGVIENGVQVYATPGAFPSAASRLLSIVDSTVTCNGGSDGSISVSVVNGTAPYTYSWSNSDTTASLVNLTAGTYSVTVVDAMMDTLTETFTITEPAAINIVMVVDSNVSCNGLMDGGLTATANGGTGNLTYEWNVGNAALAAQSFESTATDTWAYTASPATYNTEGDSIVNGSDDVWAVIEEFTGDIDTSSNGQYFWGIQDIDNGNGGGSFYHTLTFSPVNISGETGVKFAFDYYSIGFDSSDSIEYQVQFDNGTNWDSNGVALNKNTQAWTTVTVNIPDTANFVRVRLQAKQDGSTDYGAFDNIQLFTGANSITGVSAGSYTVTVTDSLGCTSTAMGIITEPAALSATLTATDASTIGGADGSIAATINGGTASYSYLWSNGDTTANTTGLTAGTYLLTVTDANGCTIVDSATVLDPAAIVLVMDSSNVSCFGAADGTAKVVASGGSSTYSYLWSNMATTDSIGGLVPGTYVVTVSDLSNSVIAVDSVVISEPSPLQLSFAVTNTSAISATDGAIDLSVNGGTPGYIYNWSNSSTTEDLTGLPAGTYVVIVNDANGCQITDSAQVLEPGVLANLVITEINYNGPESGTDTSEFIEFTNAGSNTVSLNGYFFSQGVTHTFASNDSIAAGQYYVIAFDSASFRNRYGFDADAEWTSGGLSNGGEDIIIVDNFGRGIDTVDFDDSAPWPVNSATLGPDGNGASIELQTALSSNNNDGANWVASALAVPGVIVNGFQVFGSPGNPNTTGISTTQVDKNSLKVYPNPTRGIITIERENDSAERIQIISIDGKVLSDIQSTQKAIIMDLSEFSNGVYFLRIGNDTQRIVLTR